MLHTVIYYTSGKEGWSVLVRSGKLDNTVGAGTSFADPIRLESKPSCKIEM